MRLRRIEAVRYGALANTSLGELGPGLTVVLGPNEAGKSSYTSLVRHVLYGYPNLRDSEDGYHVPGDGRCARLVFDDGDGSWVVERTEGTHGGTLRVKPLSGAERPSLVDDLTRGVSSRTFRTVFGFGLDQMPAIAQERGSDDGVVARLYAAGAGLRVNPQEVRAAIDREASELFKPAGRKQQVNELVGELRTVRAELRELRTRAEAFLADQARLHEMDEQLERARLLRDAAHERVTELAVALERVEERRSAIAAGEEALPELLRQRAQLAEEAAALAPDEALLAAGPEIDALLDEAAGHARALQALAESEAAVVRARTRYADAIDRTGLAPEAAEALGESHDAAAVIEQAREDLQRLQVQCETRDEGLQRAAAQRAQAEAERTRVTAPLGISQPEPSEEIEERLAALDALEAERGGTPRSRGVDIPSAILLLSGLVAVVTGIVLAEWITAGIGAALTVVGVALLLRTGRGAPAMPGGDERAYLRVLGLDGSPSSLDLSRMRRSLEAARAADGAVAAAARLAQEAQRESELGCDALSTRRALWSAWLETAGLDPTITPAAAASLLALAREARGQRSALDEATQAHEHLVSQLDAFAARFAQAAGPFLGLQSAPARDEVPSLSNRLREKLAESRAKVARQEAIAREIAGFDARIAGEGERADKARQDLLEVLERFDLAEGGTAEDLRVLHETARRAEAEATASCDELAQAKHQLEGRLESGARDRRTGELHLEESSLTERLAETVDRYLVLSLASRLLGDAQARFQRERQPEVVRRAGEIFSAMTGGRYVGLTVPLGEGDIEVIDAHTGVRTSDVLSRGTAEQLYLAVRLGLISQLGDVGRGLPVIMDDVLVNFDPGRRHGAASAIAALADSRQVLFFTCHPETADLLAEVAPDHTRLEIARLG